MATAPTSVGVIGLKALLRDVKKLSADSGDLYKALSAAGRRAVEPVAAVTRSTLPHVSGDLAGDVRATGTRSGAAVRMGRSTLRYAGWVEFGGTRMAPRESTRDYDSRGRYLFPPALTLAGPVAELYAQGVQQALDAFKWTNDTSDGGAVSD